MTNWVYWSGKNVKGQLTVNLNHTTTLKLAVGGGTWGTKWVQAPAPAWQLRQAVRRGFLQDLPTRGGVCVTPSTSPRRLDTVFICVKWLRSDLTWI